MSPTTRALDYTATSEYLRARAEAIRTTEANLPLNRSSAESVLAYVRSECPGALRGTPAVETGTGQSVEERAATAGIVWAIERSITGRLQDPLNASAARQFARKVASLRWANRGFTHLVGALMGIDSQVSREAPINVCRTIRGWVASSYRTVPEHGGLQPLHGAAGEAWLHAMHAIGCLPAPPLERVLLEVLRPYERPGSHPTARQVETMEVRLWAHYEDAKRSEVDALFQALGLPIPPRRPLKPIKDLKAHQPIPLRCGKK